MKGNVMSNHNRRKPERIVVPGLAYFTPDTTQPIKRLTAVHQPELAALEQMFDYFCD